MKKKLKAGKWQWLFINSSSTHGNECMVFCYKKVFFNHNLKFKERGETTASLLYCLLFKQYKNSIVVAAAAVNVKSSSFNVCLVYTTVFLFSHFLIALSCRG